MKRVFAKAEGEQPTICKDEQASKSGLYDATPGCDGMVKDAPGGGVRCTKCHGWFCF